MTRLVSAFRCLTISFALLGAFAVITFLRLHIHVFDGPVAKAVNALAAGDNGFNRLVYAATYPVIQGAVVLSLLWCCWFLSREVETRMRIVRGTAAAICVAVVAHFMHDSLGFSPKPLFEPTLALHTPAVLGDADTLRETSHPLSPSFPSERAVLFAGLAVTALTVSRPLGLLVVFATTTIEMCRVYLGMHYPSDIAGSACLAAASVWFAEAGEVFRFGRGLVKWEQASAVSFYLCAALISYEIVIAFDNIRDVTAILSLH
jgi:membrane-associated phospholipid phosphatase